MGGEWMMGKFATASVPTLLLLTILLGAPGFAQTEPAGQTPAAPPTAAAPAAQPPTAPTPTAQQTASGQEPADEDSISRRKARPHDYKNWSFNIGAGASLVSGPTFTFVRNGGFGAAAGVARNANKYLGLRADFIFSNLPLRDSTQQLAQATGATSYVYSVTLDPIINIPVSKLYSGYVLIGPSFYHRSGKLDSDTTVPGSPCNSFWVWWGACTNGSISLSNSFVSSNQSEFGYNFGAGVARKMPSGVEIYGEYRFMHGTHNNITTDMRPITIGVRW
jgi:opacity protein-like surface antigen